MGIAACMYKPEEIAKFKETIIKKIPLGKSLTSIIDENNLCNRVTVYTWLNENHNHFDKDFLNNYMRAREDQADFYADQIIDISDTEKDPAKARVRIDARKWKAGKLKPKVYGDRVDVTTDGQKMELRIGCVKVIRPED